MALPRGAMGLSAVVIVVYPDHTRLLSMQAGQSAIAIHFLSNVTQNITSARC